MEILDIAGASNQYVMRRARADAAADAAAVAASTAETVSC